MSLYALVRTSTKITDADVLRLLEANQRQLVEDFAPAWGIVASKLVIAAPAQPLPAGAIPVNLRDALSTDPPEALAFHAVESGRPVVHVLVDRIVSLSSAALNAVSCALGHEIMESDEDLYTDEWSEVGDGTEEPREVVDRVQSGSYLKQLSDGSSLAVTNFLFPAAFNSSATSGPFDQCGLLKHPRDVAPGAYKYTRPVGGGATTVFGDKAAALCYSHGAAVRHHVDLDALRREVDDQIGALV